MFLFEQLTSHDLDVVVDAMVRRDVPKGSVIIKQGALRARARMLSGGVLSGGCAFLTPAPGLVPLARRFVYPAGDLGDAFYVVGDGKFDILIDGVGKVAEREAGSFFGELALL